MMVMDFDTTDSLNPDTEDLLQQDDGPLLPVGVRLAGGAAGVHQLPARVANARTINVSDGAGGPDTLECLAAEDPRREYITILCTGNPLILGHNKQDVAKGVAGTLPINIPLTLRTSAEIWARCATPAAVSAVSYWTGEWAD